MPTLSYKCPSCGAPLTYKPGIEKSSCDYCGSAFTIEELEAYNSKFNDEKVVEEVSQGEHVHHDHAEEIYNGYHCQSCGAEVVTDTTTSATFCYYCHNPVIVTERLKGEFKPDKIIPFTVDREKALSIFQSWVKNKRYVPNNFKSQAQMEKLTGMYLPYWIADGSADVSIEGTGEKSGNSWTKGDTKFTEVTTFSFARKGEIEVDNISELAFTKIDNELINSVTPYSEKEIKAFSPIYLSGFFAETYDRNKEDVASQISRRIEEYTDRVIENTTGKYGTTKFTEKNINYQIKSWYYGLYPAWVMTYHYKGKTYVYAINGQTGKTFGELPVDNGKVAITSGITAAIVAALGMLVGWFL
ncbi:MAG: hypothetical protein GXZ11_05125 [Tissierellia bacterium]|nr:hypothetical protein [Tissierellia bacterium]